MSLETSDEYFYGTPVSTESGRPTDRLITSGKGMGGSRRVTGCMNNPMWSYVVGSSFVIFVAFVIYICFFSGLCDEKGACPFWGDSN